MSHIAEAGPVRPSTMSEVILAVGALAADNPVQSVEFDTDMGIRIVARNIIGWAHWAAAVGAEQFDDGRAHGYRTAIATGEVAEVPVTVVAYLTSAVAS